MWNKETFANIVFGVTGIAIIIPALFFTYIAKVEGQIVDRQMNNTVTSLFSDFELLLPQDKTLLKYGLSQIELPDLSAADKKVKVENDKLLKKSIIILSLILVLGAIIVGLLWYYSNPRFSLLKLSTVGAGLLIIVILVDVAFITLIAKQYDTLDPNFVKYTVIKSIHQFVNM